MNSSVHDRNQPAVENEAIAAHLEAGLNPRVYNQMGDYRQGGLRSRILGGPLRVAAVLTRLWRQVPSVHELSRLFARANLLWSNAVHGSRLSDALTRDDSGGGESPAEGDTWYRYITSVLNPTPLPPYGVADLDARRWQIETAFHRVKRLLGLAHLWTGSRNGIKLQIWATGLFHAVWMDLADAVANELEVPTDSISVELLFRGLYHFHQAHSRGKPPIPIADFAALENADLDRVKTVPKSRQKPPLDFSPYPDLTMVADP